MNTQQSTIQHNASGGVTLAGPDAVACFRAFTLASALRMYARTGIKPTRGISGPDMLRMAHAYTGKTYKRTQYEQAAADVRKWAEEMRDAIPLECKA